MLLLETFLRSLGNDANAKNNINAQETIAWLLIKRKTEFTVYANTTKFNDLKCSKQVDYFKGKMFSL